MIKASELVLNKDGSVYHLNLLPEHLAKNVILVGDPGRVKAISKHFDNLEIRREKREFVTHTGSYKNTRISVVSSGIGTDNIDIVFNELDALVNIDLKNRRPLEKLSSLNIVRVGTSGGLHPEIPLDGFVVSEYGLGFDGLVYYYQHDGIIETDLSDGIAQHILQHPAKAKPYVIKCDAQLFNHFYDSSACVSGMTATNVGFYAPQGRTLRIALEEPDFMDKIVSYQKGSLKITNMEMETSAIYAMSKLMGHRALSLNAIIANRALGSFSENPYKTIDDL
ncbi:MAG: nucleoside phosphorylase, partial [Flavobacteriaceae bacterium]|nr:nucleoside phosphorylase [Flavobacteriaceae bacterium]